MSADVSTVTISVGYLSTTVGISVNYRPIVGRYLADSDSPQWSTEYRWTYWSTYRAELGRYVQHNADIKFEYLYYHYSSSDRSTLNRVTSDVLRDI